MDGLYGHGCPACGGLHNEAGNEIVFDPEALSKGLREIYDGLDVKNVIERFIFEETLRQFNEAAAKGVADSMDPAAVTDGFMEQVRTNNAVFSAFRTHRMQNDVARLLVDADGRLKSFDRWMQDIRGITSHYVGNWLRSEYSTAVIRAHRAADWKHFEDEADVLPNLQWMPTTSPNQDPLHRQYWEKRLTLPVNHPFWDEHRPGDRWNCKCSLKQTDDPANDGVIRDFQPVPKQPGLDGNPARDGKIFSDSHPYFTKAYPGAKEAVSKMNVMTEKVIRATKKEMIDSVLDNVHNKKLNNTSAVVGKIEKPVLSFLKTKGIQPQSDRLIVSDVRMQHALRDSKAEKGIGMPETDLVKALSNLTKCDIYYDDNKKNLWYIWHTPKQLYKLIFDFNEKIKVDRVKLKVNQLLTAGKVYQSDLDMKNMTKIK